MTNAQEEHIILEHKREHLLFMKQREDAERVVKGFQNPLRISMFFREHATNLDYFLLVSKITETALSQGFNVIVISEGNNQDGRYLHGIAVNAPNYVH